jgi:hypothetical protein
LQADALVPCFLLAIMTVSSWLKTHVRFPDWQKAQSNNVIPFYGF